MHQKSTTRTLTWLRSTLVLIVLAAIAGPSQTVRAQPPTAAAETTAQLPPRQLESDWIRFKSNEWLRGSFDGLEDDDLEFDSKELDDLNLDWDDIAEVHCAKQMTCLFEDKLVVTGMLSMRDGVVTVTSSDGVQRFDRERLLAVIRGTPRESNYWSGELKVGLTTRSGNTDQIESTVFAEVIRRSPSTRTTLEFRSAFGEIENEKTVNNQRFTGRFDVTVSRKFYVTPFQLSAIRDEFQNIDYRVTPGAGLGYELIDKGPAHLEIGSGGAYQYTRYESVAAGEDDDDGTAAAFGRLEFDYDITSDIEFDSEYSATIAIPDTQDWTHSLRASIEIDLPASLELDITGIWEHINNPEPGSDGERPEEDDFTLTVGIGWTF